MASATTTSSSKSPHVLAIPFLHSHGTAWKRRGRPRRVFPTGAKTTSLQMNPSCMEKTSKVEKSEECCPPGHLQFIAEVNIYRGGGAQSLRNSWPVESNPCLLFHYRTCGPVRKWAEAVVPESKMFMVPDNWKPRTCFVVAGALPRSIGIPGPSAALNDEYTTCVVEEEPPNSPIELQANTEVPGRRETKNELQTPPSPPLLHSEQLQLIFEIRSLVDDLLFRTVHVGQRLDMLYATYSSTTPRQQCPTCSQPFAIPASSGKAKEAHEDSGD